MDFAHILRASGIKVVEVGDWRARVRPGTFRPEGVVIHHTGGTGFDATLKLVRDGRPDLNGPLCNIYVAKGTCYVISAGRANHAGAGSSKALASLRKNSAPTGSAKELGYEDDFTGANGIFVGIEVLSPGKPAVKLAEADWRVTSLATAAILRNLRIPNPARAIGHAEWTRRKVDPQFGRGPDAHVNMDRFRQRLRADLGL